MSVSIGGCVYSALHDPGATCSVAGPELGECLASRLKPSNSRIHAVDGKGSEVLGTLPVMSEIDGECRSIKFRVVDAVDQPMILGMDFGRTFDIETEWYPRKWRRRGGRWHKFVTETGGRDEVTIDWECAGLSSISNEQRSEVDKLVDEALASQKDRSGLTQLIEHHIRVGI